ncbi:unnamed protein product [Protopolystoma xenopodis]|uniref:Uncharacterized protein n=1 Tax=Protopolystoma xenopodis TaxID=117903 RepID=A0A3S5FH22_9PLAT|nr:unnamed protein product [Protopolystoma xenopodis]
MLYLILNISDFGTGPDEPLSTTGLQRRRGGLGAGSISSIPSSSSPLVCATGSGTGGSSASNQSAHHQMDVASLASLSASTSSLLVSNAYLFTSRLRTITNI